MTIEMVINIVAGAFLFAGFFFFFTSTVGLLRLPDFYSRLHATGKGDTLGVCLCLIGLAIHEGLNLVSLKIVFIAAFMFLAQPTATHAISRAGLKSGLKIWTRQKDTR